MRLRVPAAHSIGALKGGSSGWVLEGVPENPNMNASTGFAFQGADISSKRPAPADGGFGMDDIYSTGVLFAAYGREVRLS